MHRGERREREHGRGGGDEGIDFRRTGGAQEGRSKEEVQAAKGSGGAPCAVLRRKRPGPRAFCLAGDHPSTPLPSPHYAPPPWCSQIRFGVCRWKHHATRNEEVSTCP